MKEGGINDAWESSLLLLRGSQYVVQRAFVEFEARVVYRGLEPAIRDLKAQELSLKSI